MDINKFKDIWDSSIDSAIKNIEEGKHLSKFKIKPVPPKEFFEVWLKQPLFPMQYEVLNQVFTNNYMDWNTSVNEIVLIWGEGSGKDYTIVRTLIYVCYWLCCLMNPQEYFKLGKDTPIVIANMSVNEDHAKDVFFSQFTTCLRSVINPATGNNFFEELGVDLREGKDIQTRRVLLPNHIEAYALDQCLHGSELILTDRGWLPIGLVVNNKLPVKVMSMNFKTNTLEWKPVKYYFRGTKPRDLKWVKVYTNFKSSRYKGHCLVCTEDHKLLTPSGIEIRARDLKPGDKVLVYYPQYSDVQLQVIYGSVIGDGWLSRDHTVIRFSQTAKRLEYLKFKHEILQPFSGKLYTFKNHSFGTESVCCSFCISHDIKRFPAKSYINYLPLLNDIGLATWYADDGNLSKDELISISLYYPLSRKEQRFIENYFRSCLGLKSATVRRYISKTGNKSDIRLTLNKEDSKIFLSRIAKYIPSCMNYKLGKFASVSKFSYPKYQFIPTIAEVERVDTVTQQRGRLRSYSFNTIYNIEVEDNHNYFANGICVSNSKYAAEGKNVLFAVFDEIAEFRFDKAKQRYENLKNTAFSRFPEHYKIAMLSYPRDEYDFLMTHMKEVQNWPEELKSKVYIKVAAPWEVRSKEGAHSDLIKKRLYRTKADYIQMYRTDPIDAMRRYECKFPESGINRFLKKFDIVLSRCVNFDRPSPFVWESIGKEKEIYLTEKELNEITLQPWFKNAYTYEIYQLEQRLLERPNDEQIKKKLELEIQKHENAQYFIHIDLSRGIKDCAGLAVIHPYYISPTITGYYVDLVVQIRPEDVEIDFEEIRRFIFKLNDKGFDIAKVTLDGFQSADFCQIVKKRGIDSDIISVDRSRKPYDTFKSLLYQGKVNMYNYLVLIRELKELIVTSKGKVDHPEESQQRLKEEGLKEGSKDCSDAVCGAIYTAVLQETEFGPSVVDETDLETPDVEDIL